MIAGGNKSDSQSVKAVVHYSQGCKRSLMKVRVYKSLPTAVNQKDLPRRMPIYTSSGEYGQDR
jgi:hypothetical protein